MNCEVIVYDHDGEIKVTKDDMLKYTTESNVIAAALMIRMYKLSFSLLSPDEPVNRRELYFTVGFPGPGILDCVEFISHAVRDGRCIKRPFNDFDEAPEALIGQFLFTISYRGKSIDIWPSKNVFDDEFRDQVKTWQWAEPNQEREAFIKYKDDKVKQIMSLSDSDLFSYKLSN